MCESTSRETAIAHDLDIVRVVVHDALHEAFHMNADPYEDEPLRFAVAFPSGEIVEVQVGTPRRVIPIEEHEAALAELADVRADLAATFREGMLQHREHMAYITEAQATEARLRDALTHYATRWAGMPEGLCAAAALADTQHPSTPGGTE